MPALTLLNKQLIEKQLKKNLLCRFTLDVFDSIDSTNRYLKTLANPTDLSICLAETQTQGRGRFGRQWHSPYAENIYCSSRWNLPLAQCSGLSLLVSLSLVTVLEQLQIHDNIQIKWPNDILWQDKKLGGILIELLDNDQIIIGIGLNVNSDTLNNPLTDKVWCSLYEITGNFFDRNTIITLLITQLERDIKQFQTSGLSGYMQKWQSYDYLANKSIQIKHMHKSMSGIYLGINTKGELLLKDQNNLIHRLSYGESSIS